MSATCIKDPSYPCGKPRSRSRSTPQPSQPTDAELWLLMMNSMLSFAMASTNLMRSIQTRMEVCGAYKADNEFMNTILDEIKKKVVDEKLPNKEIVDKNLPSQEVVDRKVPKKEVVDKKLPSKDVVGQKLPTKQVVSAPKVDKCSDSSLKSGHIEEDSCKKTCESQYASLEPKEDTCCGICVQPSKKDGRTPEPIKKKKHKYSPEAQEKLKNAKEVKMNTPPEGCGCETMDCLEAPCSCDDINECPEDFMEIPICECTEQMANSETPLKVSGSCPPVKRCAASTESGDEIPLDENDEYETPTEKTKETKIVDSKDTKDCNCRYRKMVVEEPPEIIVIEPPKPIVPPEPPKPIIVPEATSAERDEKSETCDCKSKRTVVEELSEAVVEELSEAVVEEPPQTIVEEPPEAVVEEPPKAVVDEPPETIAEESPVESIDPKATSVEEDQELSGRSTPSQKTDTEKPTETSVDPMAASVKQDEELEDCGCPSEQTIDYEDCNCQTEPSDDDVKDRQIVDLAHQLKQTDENLKELKKEVDRITYCIGGAKKSQNRTAEALYQEIMKPRTSIVELYGPVTRSRTPRRKEQGWL